VNNPFSADTSQQLADWYSFSHIIHGFIFYGLLKLAAPRLPVGARFLIAMGVEIAWELTENTPAVIQHYRQQALAAGYNGDSILNSVSDVLMMSAGFFLASRLKARFVIALAVGLEIFTALTIRDNLTLNVINLIGPAGWPPIQAIHVWQAGAER
jgi:hydrogenase/urease accessory protein HupE